MSWKDETALWDYQFPRLRGWWRRVEAAQPDGLPDSLGLWNSQTHWLERKIGKPSKDLLRPKQIEFGLECMRRGVSYRVCFGYQGEILWYQDFAFLVQSVPTYWVDSA